MCVGDGRVSVCPRTCTCVSSGCVYVFQCWVCADVCQLWVYVGVSVEHVYVSTGCAHVGVGCVCASALNADANQCVCT